MKRYASQGQVGRMRRAASCAKGADGFQPTAPPWLLMCPVGDLHIICDREQLSRFINVHPEMGERNVSALLGLIPGSGGQHVLMWQNAKELSWIERKTGGGLRPVVGGRGKGGLDHFVRMVDNGCVPGCSGFVKTGLQQMFKVAGKTHKGYVKAGPPDDLVGWWPANSRHLWGSLPPPPALIDFGAQGVGEASSSASHSPPPAGPATSKVPFRAYSLSPARQIRSPRPNPKPCETAPLERVRDRFICAGGLRGRGVVYKL